jgi:hypothetical protein
MEVICLSRQRRLINISYQNGRFLKDEPKYVARKLPEKLLGIASGLKIGHG